MFEASTIKKFKKHGIDIVIDNSGFKPAYYVYSAAVPEGTRFETFKEVKDFCNKLINP